ncbi:helix-turn-helix domain-containing protein [Streptomyces sp. NPDC058659]|uniref:helix-turn-helix domain-containing protein n=1 Tax=unclassified Streptomyces TaxID=2593676 RepID=UPI00364B80BC
MVRVAGLGDLGALVMVMAGIPARRTGCLPRDGPEVAAGRRACFRAMLLETLESSWRTTAPGRGPPRPCTSVRPNTVHYRVERIEALTGRDLSRLDRKTDLRAALLCR